VCDDDYTRAVMVGRVLQMSTRSLEEMEAILTFYGCGFTSAPEDHAWSVRSLSIDPNTASREQSIAIHLPYYDTKQRAFDEFAKRVKGWEWELKR
jgi:hypothetical protein